MKAFHFRKIIVPLLAAVPLFLLPTAGQGQVPQDAGQVGVYSAANVVSSNSASWVDIPGLKAAVTLPGGGDLAVTVSADGWLSTASDSAFVRVLVDDQTTSPVSMRFLEASTNRRCTTSNFFRPGLAAGQHRVRVQWLVQAGRAYLANRSMILRFATPTSANLRMQYAYQGYASRSSGSYVSIPNVAVDVDCPWDAQLVILAAGDFKSKLGKRIFIRGVVDSVPTKDVIMVNGVSNGCHSFTFTSGKLSRGRHNVQLQWLAEDTAEVSSANFLVVALNDAINYKTGWLQQSPASGATLVNSSASFVDVPGASGGLFWIPSRCDLAIRFSAEGGGDANTRLQLQVKVNSQVVPHGLTDLLTGRGVEFFMAREVCYVVRNLERGWCNLNVQWAAAGTGRAFLGDRTLTATAVIGQRPLLVTAVESKRPAGYKYGGEFASSVVNVVGGKKVFKPYVGQNFFTARPGVADWFAENARGHMHVVEAAVAGPNMKIFDEQTYRSLPNPFDAMKVEALMYADAAIDFSYYDRDGDGFVRTDELFPLVILYQDTTFGEVRSLPTTVSTQDGVTLDYRGGIASVYTPDFKTNNEIGVINHELSHLLLNAGDMYENGDPTAPGPYSMMDQHGYNAHLDPLHKLVQGRWYEAYALTTGDRWLTLNPVSKGGSIIKLYDPNSHAGEYFLVENRGGVNYDASLPSTGLAVWHCDDKLLPNWRTAVEIEPAGGLGNAYKYNTYLFTGQQPGFHNQKDLWNSSTPMTTAWHDKTQSNVGLFGIQALNDGTGNMRIFVDTAGPGVLVQFEHPDFNVDGTGQATLRLRVMNTSTTKDTVGLSLSVPGWSSWKTQIANLLPYETRFYNVMVQLTDPDVNTVTVTANGTGVSCVDTTKVRTTLRLRGSGRIGTVQHLDADNPPHAGELFAMAVALGDSPGLTLPNGTFVPLNLDSLLMTYYASPAIFSGFFGTLDFKGIGHSQVNLPNVAGIKGIKLHFAYVTATKTGTINASSNGVNFMIN